MKPIERGEIMGLADYESVRDRFRARVIKEKKARRVKLGEQASCIFENRDTVLMQIQEMLRTERITREPSILHEMETYNALIPGPHELSATIFIEIDEKEDRERFLVEAKGLESTFALVFMPDTSTVKGIVCKAKHDPAREHPERTTAVHYVKFNLAPEAEQLLRDVLEKKRQADDIVVELTSGHPRYAQTTRLPPSLVANLAEDLL